MVAVVFLLIGIAIQTGRVELFDFRKWLTITYLATRTQQ